MLIIRARRKLSFMFYFFLYLRALKIFVLTCSIYEEFIEFKMNIKYCMLLSLNILLSISLILASSFAGSTRYEILNDIKIILVFSIEEVFIFQASKDDN